MAVATLTKLNDLVSAAKIRHEFPTLPPPVRVTVMETVDHSGEEAYDIAIVFPDSIPDKALQWDKISPMVDWIREQIFSHRDSNRWPYFWFRRESDMKPSKKRWRG
jgi:hypothetical protein